MLLTLALLALLATVFITGFKEAIGLATIVCIPYLLLNVVVSGRCLVEVLHHPEALRNWQAAIHGPRRLDRDFACQRADISTAGAGPQRIRNGRFGDASDRRQAEGPMSPFRPAAFATPESFWLPRRSS